MNKEPLILWSVNLPPLHDSVLRYYAWLHGQSKAPAMRDLLMDFAREYFHAGSFNEFVESSLLPGDTLRPDFHRARTQQVDLFLRGPHR